MDFSCRSNLSEIIDSEETDFATFRACFIDLAKVNRLTLAYRPTLQFFKRLARCGHLTADRAITVVDVGSGFGDMLRKIDQWAGRRGFEINLIGVDRNPWSARVAEQATAPGRPIQFVTADVFEYQPPGPIDIVISSLFAHHLEKGSLIRFLSWMETNATLGWFVNDIHRQLAAYHLFGFFTRALRIHHVVRHDGMVSIARAFDVSDWRSVLNSADVPSAATKVRPVFPFRLCVSRFKAA